VETYKRAAAFSIFPENGGLFFRKTVFLLRGEKSSNIGLFASELRFQWCLVRWAGGRCKKGLLRFFEAAPPVKHDSVPCS
jgi:hypothetical protein